MRLKTWLYLLAAPPVALLVSLLAADSALLSAGHRSHAAVLVVLTLTALIYAVVAPVLVARRVIAPLASLTEASTRVANGDFDVSTPAAGPGEIGELNRSFSRMTADLGRLVEAQRDSACALRDRERLQRLHAERLSHLLASGPAVVFNMTVELRPRITFMSDNVLATTGFTALQFMHEKDLLFSLVHPEDAPALAVGVRQAIDEGSFAHYYRLRNAAGEYVWLHGYIRTIRDETGVPLEIAGWWIDVTEARQTAEAQRIAREAAEGASRAKSEILANMGHEIRTAMNGVMDLLELALDSDMTPEHRQYLEVAHSSAESLLGVVDDILDFSNVDPGRIDDVGSTADMLAVQLALLDATIVSGPLAPFGALPN